MDALLQSLILERVSESELAEGAADLMLAACVGRTELDAVLTGGDAAPLAPEAQQTLVERPQGVFVSTIAVQGFRGVGKRAELKLEPGPGLTLVVGRNGSGKSSFAEGLELLMTGQNSRWVDRTAVWKQGWQNLHFDRETELAAGFQVEGRQGLTALTRQWPHGSALTPGECEAELGDGGQTSLDELGWSAALSRYRPFLSYNELGSMFDELRTMYDALAAILGLEDIEALLQSLREARLAREKALKTVRGEIKQLTGQLAGVPDDRAQQVLEALTARPAELDAIELTLAGLGDEGDPGAGLATLRALCALPLPDDEQVESAFARLDHAREQLAAHAGTDAARAASLARLLEQALAHDDVHRSADCPVCGTLEVIDERWRADTARAVVRLSGEARAVEQSQREVQAAERAVAELLSQGPPGVLDRARELGLDPGPLERAWERWGEVRRRAGDPDAVAALRAELMAVAHSAGVLAQAAEAELDPGHLTRSSATWRTRGRSCAARTSRPRSPSASCPASAATRSRRRASASCAGAAWPAATRTPAWMRRLRRRPRCTPTSHSRCSTTRAVAAKCSPASTTASRSARATS
jgi:energy-coupling factor transporter ATP-binding protein EcfA2